MLLGIGGLGGLELVIIIVVILLIFGPTKLPQLGEGIGKMLRGFRKEIKQIDNDKREEEARRGEIDVEPGGRIVARRQEVGFAHGLDADQHEPCGGATEHTGEGGLDGRSRQRRAVHEPGDAVQIEAGRQRRRRGADGPRRRAGSPSRAPTAPLQPS